MDIFFLVCCRSIQIFKSIIIDTHFLNAELLFTSIINNIIAIYVTYYYCIINILFNLFIIFFNLQKFRKINMIYRNNFN